LYFLIHDLVTTTKRVKLLEREEITIPVQTSIHSLDGQLEISSRDAGREMEDQKDQLFLSLEQERGISHMTY